MHPAPSVILFTVLSGLGFGFLFFLNLGLIRPDGMAAIVAFGAGYGFAVAGLLASTFHLGNPQRALRAFTQWRTSWLSREGWASVAALLATAPVAFTAAFGPAGLGLTGQEMAGGPLGLIAAALCLATIFCTSMIYAQLKTVPRWNHWTTPVLFMAFSAAGGSILAGLGSLSVLLCLTTGVAMIAAYALGDGRFATAGASLGTATGLGGLGDMRVFMPAHTAGNYVMREMIHVVGRKHARKLRFLSLSLGAVLPALVLAVLPASLVTMLLALALHLTGAFAQRWLFFAEAEHVVSHYYGRDQT
ncbi:MAG: DmsC/YnfH family molybdoenzyme membrane anchor subunit [Paracoccaceae bacterium]